MQHFKRTSDNTFQECFSLTNNSEIISSIGAYGRFIIIYWGYFEAMFDGYFFWYTTYRAATIWHDLDKFIPVSESVGCSVGDLAIEGGGVSLIVPSHLPDLVSAEVGVASLLLGVGWGRRGRGLLWF